MISYINKKAHIWMRWVINSPFLRWLFLARLYRRQISQSEYIIRLLKNQDKLDDSYWMGKARHYAHLVDKGIHRGDFCKGHGERAYAMTRHALACVQTQASRDDPSIQWAAQKVRQYEKCQLGEVAGIREQYTPTKCKYVDLLDVIMTRRSIRNYSVRPISDEIVGHIISVLDWSPTSCNRQPARVYATNNPDLVRQCVPLHTGAACFSDIYTPLMLIFCADCRAYEMPSEMDLPYIDVSMGVQNCLLVAHSLGISLTVLSSSFRSEPKEQKLRRLFGIPPYFQIIVSAVGGYPNGGVQVPYRKAKELVLVK